MPTEFQKVMENFLARVTEVFVFIDDILFVNKRTKNEHMAKVREILNTLDVTHLQVKREMRKFSQSQIELAWV